MTIQSQKYHALPSMVDGGYLKVFWSDQMNYYIFRQLWTYFWTFPLAASVSILCNENKIKAELKSIFFYKIAWWAILKAPAVVFGRFIGVPFYAYFHPHSLCQYSVLRELKATLRQSVFFYFYWFICFWTPNAINHCLIKYFYLGND